MKLIELFWYKIKRLTMLLRYIWQEKKDGSASCWIMLVIKWITSVLRRREKSQLYF